MPTQEDLTHGDWTETDGDNSLTVTADTIAFSTLSRDETTYHSKDLFGEPSDEDFIHRFKFKWTARSSIADVVMWMLTSELGEMEGLIDGNTADFICLRCRWNATDNVMYWHLYFVNNGNEKADEYSQYYWHSAQNKIQFVTMHRKGQLVSVTVRTGSWDGPVCCEMVLNMSGYIDEFRYIQFCTSRDNDLAYWLTGELYDVFLDVLDDKLGLTFDEFIEEPSSEKVVIAEIEVGHVLLSWDLEDGSTYTYEKEFLEDKLVLADGTPATIRRRATKVEEDGVILTNKNSINQVEATAGSWSQDEKTGFIYVHPSGSDDIKTYTIIVFFELCLATQPVYLGNYRRYYEPLISSKGVPSLSKKNPNIHWGISEISSGSLKLVNNSGFFDEIFRKYLWTNRKISLKLGGPDLPYVEFQSLFSGQISDKIYSQHECTLKLKSNAFDLLRNIPDGVFDTTTFTDLDPAAEGKTIPVYYGTYTEAEAPEVTCVDTAWDTNEYQFKVADHAIKSITQVYIDYEDGVGWQTISHGDEDLAEATFTILAADYVVGSSKVKVAFEGKHTGGTLYDQGPYIVEDLLVDLCGYDSTQLNATAFTASKADTAYDLNVPIESSQSALSIIEKICASELAYFDEDNDGLLRYTIWEADFAGSLRTIETDELMSLPAIRDHSETIYWKVRVGYGYSCITKKYLYFEQEDLECSYKYAKSEELIIDTYIKGAGHVDTYSQRLMVVTKSPSPQLRVQMKTPIIDLTLGDKFNLSMARAPYPSVGGYDQRMFEIIGVTYSFFPFLQTIEARDLMEYANIRGIWQITNFPDYQTATDGQKASSGFWLNDDDLADPGDDPGSYLVSVWW